MQPHSFEASDGARLTYHSLGEGRPVVLLHGFLSSARRNWFAPGLAQALADAGLKVIAPDARGHGGSDAPTDLTRWPPDIMAGDVLDLIRHLDLGDFDLAGYSMGARTAIRACVRGLKPRRLVTGGMGETGIMEAGPRADLFEDAIRNGERAADAAMGRALGKMMADQGLSPDAMLGVLASFHPTTEAEIRALDLPALVILGEDDHDNGSAETLAAWLPQGHCQRTPGDHGTTVATPEFRDAMRGFLTLVVRA